MNPPTTVRSSQPAQAGPLLSRLRPAHLVVALVGLALFGLLTRFLAGPNFIERITFENSTVYDVSIEAAGPDRDGWVSIATARREATTAAEEVPDLGDEWVFRFSAQGENGGELRRTRAQLASDEWRVDIPESVGEQLRAAGAPPPS